MDWASLFLFVASLVNLLFLIFVIIYLFNWPAEEGWLSLAH